LKVLMVTPAFFPVKGGTETIVRNLSAGLNKLGVHTDIMTFNQNQKYAPKWRGKTEKINGMTVFKIPGLKWLPIEPSPRITQGVNIIPGRFTHLLKKYDIIHFHEADLSFPLFSLFVSKAKILHLHGIHAGFLRQYHLSRIIFKHVADYYITITRQMGRDLVELGIARNRIIYLPNAVDVKEFNPKGKKEDNLLLYLGRIVPIKGLHILLKSLNYVEKPVYLAIVGPIGSLEYYKYVKKLIEKENRKGKHKIKYLGEISKAEVIQMYQKASIYILPSFWEAFPVVILEALSCETPVITTPVGGIPEIIQNFENGIIVPVNDPVRLAEAINFMLDNKDYRTKMGQKGRELVIKNCSVEVIARKLYKIYEKIIIQ